MSASNNWQDDANEVVDQTGRDAEMTTMIWLNFLVIQLAYTLSTAALDLQRRSWRWSFFLLCLRPSQIVLSTAHRSLRPFLTKLNLIFLVLSSTLFLSSPSEAIDIICPKKILTTQSLDKQELGWQEFVRPDADGKTDTFSYASGISIYWDDPKKIIELRPDKDTSNDPSWSFKKVPPGTPPLYMACHYFETRIGFIRALPSNVKKCTAMRGGILRCEVFEP